MRRARRRFTPEFKADVVRLCRAGGESIADVARRLRSAETAVRAVGRPGGSMLAERRTR
ncbi:MAG: transposase [Polyangiaceae bacterium]